MNGKREPRRLAMVVVWVTLLGHFSALRAVDSQWQPARTVADELVFDEAVRGVPEAVGADAWARLVVALSGGAEHRLLEEHRSGGGEGPGDQLQGSHLSGEREEKRGAMEERSGAPSVGQELHHHEVATPVDLAISSMLLGCVVFIMMLFYLVNYNDDDIKFYAWSVISCTISIFTAIFLFEALDEVLDQTTRYRNLSPVHRAFVDYSVMLFWLLLLQIVIMANVGVICVKGSSDLALDEGIESMEDIRRSVESRRRPQMEPNLERHDRKVNTKTWAMLFSHMSGFASIFAAGTWQHLEEVKGQPMFVLAIVPVHLCIMYSLFLLAAQVRRCFKNKHLHPAAVHLWDEETEESENDVASLSLSFLLVQGLRFSFTGDLPDRDGLEELPEVHRWQSVLELLLCAFVFAVLTLGLVQAKSAGIGSCVYRLASILEGVSSMAFAWSLFFTSKWELKRLMPELDPNTMMPRTVLAISLSGGCCVLIFIFDMIVDLDETDETVDEAIKKIISGLSLLVGFAWEQSFEGATHNLASVSHNPVTMKVALALAVVIIVVPAWRWYILVKVQNAEAEHGATMTLRRTNRASMRVSQMSGQTRPTMTRFIEADESGTSSTKCSPIYEGLEQESTTQTEREDTQMSASDPFITPRP